MFGKKLFFVVNRVTILLMLLCVPKDDVILLS